MLNHLIEASLTETGGSPPIPGIRVVLVDDHPVFRLGLQAILRATCDDIEVVGDTIAKDALELVGRVHPDVGVMDICMPGREGIGATREILECHPSVRVLILTATDNRRDVEDALRAGAHGLLSKGAEISVLLAAIRMVGAGETVISPFALHALLEHPHSPATSLTTHERELLQLVAQGLDNTQIAKALFISNTTLKRHMHAVIARLAVKNRTQAAILASREGLL